jgi:hypothetical protein
MATMTKRLLYRLLFDALIEIRAYTGDTGDRRVYLLADLFHNVPLQLDRADRGETIPDDIMGWLHMRARQRGIEGWLDFHIEEARKAMPQYEQRGDDAR